MNKKAIASLTGIKYRKSSSVRLVHFQERNIVLYIECVRFSFHFSAFQNGESLKLRVGSEISIRYLFDL